MKKRFIAGVVCPKCGQLDTIIASHNNDEHVSERECIECGFKDSISTLVSTKKELETRVTPKLNESEKSIQIVKIVEIERKE